jgi:hypothetical protein
MPHFAIDSFKLSDLLGRDAHDRGTIGNATFFTVIT